MRDRYYSEQDRQNEKEMGALCERWWGLTFVLVSADEAPYDAEFYETSKVEPRIIAEFKRRDMRFGQYPDVVLSKHKIDRILSLVKKGTIPVFVIHTNDDTLHWVDLRETRKLPTVLGGRTRKTRDEWDVEQVVHIPNRLFHSISEVPV